MHKVLWKLLFISLTSTVIVGAAAGDALLAPEMAPEAALVTGGEQPTAVQPSTEQSGQTEPVLVNQQQPKKISFHRDYLAVYYPRAFVIGGRYFCLNLSPEQIEDALNDVVRLLKDTPWFYFEDTSNNFNVNAYWEVIGDQMAILYEYLMRLRVDSKTKKVYHLPEPGQVVDKKAKFLIDYLLEDLNSVAVPKFVALSYDFMTKLYIDAVKRENILDARHYREELSELQGNLRNTPFMDDYSEHFRNIVGSLFDLLKKRCGVSDAALEEMAMRQNRGKYPAGYHAY